MGWGYWVKDSVGSVSRYLEIWRMAGNCPRRGRVTLGKEGKSTCLRVLGSYEEDLMGPHWGWSSPPECSSTASSPLPLWKASREDEKCLHLQRGLKGSNGSVALCPAARLWCPILHVLCCCCPRGRHPPAGTSSCLQRGVGRQWQDFVAYFSQTATLWSRGTSNSEQPGHFLNT